MSSANKRRIILLRIILYSLGFGLPLLAMFGAMFGCNFDPPAVSCIIPSEAFRDFATFVYALIIISSYTLGIPILIYIAVVIVVTESIARAFKG